MPTFLDVHRNISDSPAEIALAHSLDVQVQSKYGVTYRRYWHDAERQTVNCLVDAPDIHAAIRVHAEAHGMLPDSVIEVSPEEIDRFLGPEGRDAPGGKATDGGFRAIMFTDIVDSTVLTGELGDARFQTLLREHNAIIRRAVRIADGHEIKQTGDGFLIAFHLASAAADCAISIQRMLAKQAKAVNGWPIQVRIGLSAGEPVSDEEDLFGSAIQLAARVCTLAEGGQILAAPVVAELCIGKPLDFVDVGEVSLKGFATPTHLYKLNWA